MNEQQVRILVVEDEKETAGVIRRILEKKLSATADEAYDCATARTMLRENNYDVVALDYRLPDCSELELLREIREDPSGPAVVIVTGQGDEKVASEAFLAGAAGYVVKDDKLATVLPQAVQSTLDKASLQRAEAAIKESEEFYRTLFEQSMDALYVETPEGIVEDANQTACEMMGLPLEELVGRKASDLVPPARRPLYEEAAARLRAGEIVEFENQRRDGTAFPVELSAAEVLSRRGPRFIVTVRDVSARKRAEEALHNVIRETNQRREEITALLESTRYVLEHSDFRDSARMVFDLCRNLIGAEAGYVGLVEDDHTQVSLIVAEPADAFAGREPRRMPLNPGSDMPFQAGKATFINDLALAETATEVPEGHFRVNNLLLAPLLVEGKTAGLLGFANKPGGFNKRDSMMASAFGEIASLALRNSMMVQKLEDSESRFRSIAETAGEVIICSDSDGDIVLWNEGAALTFGYEDEEVLGKSMVMLMPERFRQGNIDLMRRIKQQGWRGKRGRTYEQAGLRKDGTEVPFELSVSSFSLRGELFFTVIARDITMRKRAEDALKESEERYRQLVEAAPDGIYTIAVDGTITSLNPAFEKLTGWAIEEWIGKNFAELVHPDDLVKAVETFEAATVGEYPEPYKLRIRSSTGEYLVGEFVSVPEESSNEVIGELGIVRDVTDRERALEKLKESEELYRTLMQTSPDAVTVTDLQGNIIDASMRSIELHGAGSFDEMRGLNAFDLIAPQDQTLAMDNMKRTLEEGVLRNLEYDLVRNDGSGFIGEMNVAVLRDAEGEPRAFIATIRDITDRKRTEQELQALNVELEGYAHTVSHDLRGPLSAILGAAVTLNRMLAAAGIEDNAEIAEVADIIEQNVHKSELLIESLLDLAEAGQRPSKVSPVDIDGVVARVIEELKEEINEKSVTVAVDTDLGAVRGDDTQLYQLFANLVRNAVRHNDSEAPAFAVRKLSTHGTAHRYLVTDNGSGIDEEQLEQIFLPFFTGEGGETGIGLGTVDKIVKAYGGSIRAYNDGGACFEFVINDLP